MRKSTPSARIRRVLTPASAAAGRSAGDEERLREGAPEAARLDHVHLPKSVWSMKMWSRFAPDARGRSGGARAILWSVFRSDLSLRS